MHRSVNKMVCIVHSQKGEGCKWFICQTNQFFVSKQNNIFLINLSKDSFNNTNNEQFTTQAKLDYSVDKVIWYVISA